MSASLVAPTFALRSSLFGIVAGAHFALLLMLAVVKVAAPVSDEHTIAAEILPMAGGGAVAMPVSPLPAASAPPLPAVRERPRPDVKPLAKPDVKAPVPVAKKVEPPVELSTSTLPAESGISSSPSASADIPTTSVAPSNSVGGRSTVGGGTTPAGGVAGSSSVGDGTSQARFDADYLRNPRPPYPAISRRMREEGKVTLRVLVTPDGSADSVEIKSSSGSARLDEAALRTVRQWRFIPARRGDVAVQSWVLVPVIFKLEQ